MHRVAQSKVLCDSWQYLNQSAGQVRIRFLFSEIDFFNESTTGNRVIIRCETSKPLVILPYTWLYNYVYKSFEFPGISTRRGSNFYGCKFVFKNLFDILYIMVSIMTYKVLLSINNKVQIILLLLLTSKLFYISKLILV